MYNLGGEDSVLDEERVMKLGIWRRSNGAELVRVVAYEKTCHRLFPVTWIGDVFAGVHG